MSENLYRYRELASSPWSVGAALVKDTVADHTVHRLLRGHTAFIARWMIISQ